MAPPLGTVMIILGVVSLKSTPVVRKSSLFGISLGCTVIDELLTMMLMNSTSSQTLGVVLCKVDGTPVAVVG